MTPLGWLGSKTSTQTNKSDSLIQIVDINSDTKWQTVQIQIWSGSTLFAKAVYIQAQQYKG